jgi:three-Cys-motif partner protein
MSHKADSSFFDEKREWSNRKDLFLKQYIHPYIEKVKKLDKPIAIVDAFAGPGLYKDGSLGSPLIIANEVQKSVNRNQSIDVQLICCESDRSIFLKLQENLRPYRFAKARNADFGRFFDEVRGLCQTCTTFLYLDPYTMSELKWKYIDNLLSHISKNSSVEILINFNSAIIMRIAMSRLKSKAETNERSFSDDDDDEDGEIENIDSDAITDVLGNKSWQLLAEDKIEFSRKVRRLTEQYCNQLKRRCQYVCATDIFKRTTNKVPKYTMIFGSRSVHALDLMNEAAVKARKSLLNTEQRGQLQLFEHRPADVAPTAEQLDSLILGCVEGPTPVDNIREHIMLNRFGDFSKSEMKTAIDRLIDQKKLIGTRSLKARVDAVSKPIS